MVTENIAVTSKWHIQLRWQKTQHFCDVIGWGFSKPISNALEEGKNNLVCQKKTVVYLVISLNDRFNWWCFWNSIFEFSEHWQTVLSVAVMLSDNMKFGECPSIRNALWWVLLDSFYYTIVFYYTSLTDNHLKYLWKGT